MANRPFFNYSGKELAAYYHENIEDIRQLSALLEELRHRKTPSMVQLRTKVEASYTKLKDSEPPSRLQPIQPLLYTTPNPAEGLATVPANEASAPSQPQPTEHPICPHASEEMPTSDSLSGLSQTCSHQQSSENTVSGTKPPAPTATPGLQPIREPSVPHAPQSTVQTCDTAASPLNQQYRPSTVETPPDGNDQVTGKSGHIRPCGVLPDVPTKWVPAQGHRIKLNFPDNAARKDRYQTALEALIQDMRRKGSGSKKITVENGTALHLDGAENGYKFNFEGDQELFEGAALRAFIRGIQSAGRIVSISGKEIILTLDRSFGPSIPEAVLQIDNTAMLEALVQRFKDISEGGIQFNTMLADELIENSGKETSPTTQSAFVKDKSARHELNDKQAEAVAMALANNVSYLWGPPGTGKTRTLGALVDLLFDMKKRVLVCSNTNQAVDQVLLKICNLFGITHSALQEGKVIRIGKIHHQELASEFYPFVSVEGISERKSKDLVAEKDQIIGKILKIQDRLRDAQQTKDLFQKHENEQKELQGISKRLETLNLKQASAKQEINVTQAKVGSLTIELDSFLKAGAIRRILMRSEMSIKVDLHTSQMKLKDSIDSFEIINAGARELILVQQDTQQRVNKLLATLVGRDLGKAIAQITDGEKEIATLNARMSKINNELQEIAKSVMDNAMIVGATVTKSYLSPQYFTNFDVIIVDEASMVMLPALYYVCGLSKDKIIISGDFLQLAPIIPTNEESILDTIGGDVFCAAGIPDAFFNDQKLNRTVMLDSQFRMDKSICDLISKWMYNDNLYTGATNDHIGRNAILSAPYDSRTMIIDTSPIMPFVNRDESNFRYNLMNGMIVRNLFRSLKDKNHISDDPGQIGICTPYASQAKLLKRILDGLELSDIIEAGTVHRYQGDEKELMIIDVPDSFGERVVGMFLQADTPSDNGAKLFNVAVSRAKQQLFFIANLAYLDKKLPQNAFVRSILHAIQTHGKVIDCRDILSLWPIEDDLARLGKSFELSQETLKNGLFSQVDFHKVFMADIESAQNSIVIFSGFFTPNRVAAYADLFRSKLSKGVNIRCITRPPNHNGSMDEADGKETLDALERMGVIVDTRWEIHEKVALLDGNVVWFGSLNPLSHTDTTSEVMARIESPDVANQLAMFLMLKHTAKKDSDQGGPLCTLKENPNCHECGRRATLRKGKFGLYWQCEGNCGWTGNLNGDSKSATHQNPLAGQPAPTCEKCAKPMVPRWGKGAPFWGCAGYPDCRFTRKAKIED